jgi:hypothetical protein
MSDEEPPFDPNDARAVYDRISLTEEQLQHLYWMSTRRRDLRALLSEVVFFSGCLAGRSPRIDAAARYAPASPHRRNKAADGGVAGARRKRIVRQARRPA